MLLISLMCKSLMADDISGIGLYLKNDYANAALPLEKECRSGSPFACGALGDMYLLGSGVDKNISYGTKLISKSCDLHPGLGCIQLGDIFLNANNYKKAIQYYSKACYGSKSGCYQLAKIYYDGKGVKLNKLKAIDLFKVACENYGKDACVDLGFEYYNGTTVSKDIVKAKEYSKKGCELGNQNGCNNYQIMMNESM